MPTLQYQNDNKYAIGAFSDGLVKTAPASTYSESDFSFNVIALTPQAGGLQRCEVYPTSSAPGFLSDLDLIVTYSNTHATDVITLSNWTKLIQKFKIWIDNIAVFETDGVDANFLHLTRNLLLTSIDEGDYRTKWNNMLGETVQFSGLDVAGEVSTLAGTEARTITIPLSLLTGGLFKKLPLNKFKKITIEIGYRGLAVAGTASEVGTFSTNNTTAATNPHSSITTTDCKVRAKFQLYEDASIMPSVNTPYWRPLIQSEQYNVTTTLGGTITNTATFTCKLADQFAAHKRVLGLCIKCDTDGHTNYGTGVVGQVARPYGIKCTIKKGGKTYKELDYNQFLTQSVNFVKGLGATWLPACSDPADSDHIVAFHGNAVNFVSFLDEHVVSGDGMEYIGGISNDTSSTWSIDFTLQNSDGATYNTVTTVYCLYASLLQLHDGKVKVFA